MYQQLAQLIRDGVWLKSYIAAVMRVEQASHTCNVLLYHLALLAGDQSQTLAALARLSLACQSA